jgi:hypothetical protein
MFHLLLHQKNNNQRLRKKKKRRKLPLNNQSMQLMPWPNQHSLGLLPTEDGVEVVEVQ